MLPVEVNEKPKPELPQTDGLVKLRYEGTANVTWKAYRFGPERREGWVRKEDVARLQLVGKFVRA